MKEDLREINVVKRSRTSPSSLRAKIDQGITAKIFDEAKGLSFEIRFGEHYVKIQGKSRFVFFMHNSVLIQATNFSTAGL